MKVLFIGGTGNISWYCTMKAIEEGHDVFILNRGKTIRTRREPPEGVKQLHADMRYPSSVKKALNGLSFDVVADFICYKPEQAHMDVELFRGITKQFVFISSTAVYQRPCVYPITEDNPVCNTWEYAQDKIWCERIFMERFRSDGFPVTIVRPGHTYDTLVPDALGSGDWTNCQRMLDGKPIVVLGDGTNLWTLTHAEDFADAFVRLFGTVIGGVYHITGDELLTWREITMLVGDALGVKPDVVFVPSETINKLNPIIGAGLLGHKTWCDIYDNSKIKDSAKGWKQKILFRDGIRRTINWLRESRIRQRINPEIDVFIDDLCRRYR